MIGNYAEFIEYFSQKEKPKQVLSEIIDNEYSCNDKELPQVYKDVEKEYSQINIPDDNLNSDTISMIFWDMAFLSDEFICYCLPILIPKAIEYEDTVLLSQLKKLKLEKLSKNDANEVQKLIIIMEADERFRYEEVGTQI